MFYLVLITLIWAIVTVIGHSSWLLVSVILKAASGAEAPQPAGPNLDDDVAATHRVLSLMSSRKLLDPDEVRLRRREVDGLKAREWKLSQQGSAAPDHEERSSPRSESRQDFRPGQGFRPTEPKPKTQATPAPRASQHWHVSAPGPQDEPAASEAESNVKDAAQAWTFRQERTVEAMAGPPESSRATESSQARTARQRSQPLSSEPVEPRLSFGESMAAFLADHNIRWGELLAGAMIVVCSIGLVISLWETLTDTHRVIPSLIFMTGNAAIFGAGLYTFFRWRLPDTSRTMLLIAMLLVPLGILAGLSTGGIGTNAVMLTDPITVGVILLAGLIYVWMLWQASRALVGSKCASALTLGVAGPAAVLPVIPAAIRTWGSSAGMVIALASIAVWLSQRLSLTQKGKGVFFSVGAVSVPGEAFVRQRAILTSVSLFTFSVAVGYLAFMLREFEASWATATATATAALTAAIATLPGIVAFSAAMGSLSHSRRHAKIAFAGVVSSIGLGLGGAALMIPALVSMKWLFAWGIVFSISSLAAAWVFRSPRWTLLSSIPFGIATVLSSPSFLDLAAWESVPVWRRMIGGEPMLAAFGVGVSTLLLRLVFRDRLHRRSALIASAGWIFYGVANTAVLTISPASLLGAVPVWSLPVLLAFATLFVVFAAIRFPVEPANESRRELTLVGLGCGLTFSFWVSILRPFVIGIPFPGLKPLVLALAASGLCLLLFAEMLRRRLSVAKLYRFSAVVFISIAAGLSIPLSISFSSVAITILLVSTISLWWIAVGLKDATTMGLSRLASLFSMLLIGHHGFGAWLSSAESCRSLTALWGWSVATMGLAIFAYGQDVLTSWINSKPEGETIGNAPAWWKRSAISQMSFRVATCLAGLAAMLSYGTLVWTVLSQGGAEYVISEVSIQFALPAFVLAGLLCAAVFESRIWNSGKNTLSFEHRFSGISVSVSVLLWCGWQFGMRCFTEIETQLVVATSFAAAGCFLIELVRRGHRGVMPWVGMAILAFSSIALMMGGWIPSVMQGVRPSMFATVAVAVWWTASAMTSGWVGWRDRSSLHLSTASIVGTAIVVLVSPLWVPRQPWIWVQCSAIFALLAGLALRFLVFRGRRDDAFSSWFDQSFEAAIKPACDGLQNFGVWCGLSTCIAVVVGILADSDLFFRLHNPAGIMLSTISAASLVFFVRGKQVEAGTWKRFWPIGISLLSGHVVLIMLSVALKSGLHFGGAAVDAHGLLSSLWILAASISLIQYWVFSIRDQKSDRANLWHAAALVLGATAVTLMRSGSSVDFALALVASGLGVLLVTVRTAISAWDSGDHFGGLHRSVVGTRIFAWVCLGTGVSAIIGLWANQSSLMHLWTMVLMWIGSATLIWRVVVPEATSGNDRKRVLSHRLADGEGTVVVLFGLVIETLLLWCFPADAAPLSIWQDSLFWCRLGTVGLVSLSAAFRCQRVGMLEVGVLTGLVSVTLAGMRLATEHFVGVDAFGRESVAMVACLVSATGFSMLVFRWADVCALINGIAKRWHGLVPPSALGRPVSLSVLNRSLIRVSVIPVVASLMVCGWLIVVCNGHWVTAVAVCGIVMLAIAIGELAEQADRVRLRDIAVTLGLTAVAMLASVNVVADQLPMLSLSTRWFVGWVLVSVSLALGLPKLFSEAAVLRWRQPIRRGMVVSLLLAVVSLSATLVQEALVRTGAETDQLNNVLVLGMAVVLAMLSFVATFAGIVSGPGYSYREIWRLSDRQRAGLIVAAQVMGGLTWFHLFLCKNPIASLGLRAYWPYVVMALAFASTGITEWARRRGDQVLQKILMQTAFYLPLIPVIGFWLSGSLVTSFFGESTGDSWSFINGKVTYQTLLIAAAVYYGVISFLWKSGRTRVMSIVIGNLALWVVLMQTPGWSFLAHPQAWLVPPALCALVATHFYRDSLGRDSVSAIRYASTLVIYVTSTADMLIQGVGATIAGPIVLIVLALAGVTAGVALRVRPFLYLGATFVMLGLLSMVWHAQQQIDAVWPWWVFGITTGVLLLAGLMGIEKNKPKLKLMAASLSTWG